MARCVQALYDYDRSSKDELSFKKGDTIFVHRENDSGWWYGSHNGLHGLFPSNYVISISKLQLDLKSLQNEILNHILEGEIKQIKEISILLNDFVIHAEQFSSNSFANKLRNLRNLLTQGQNLHQDLATSLEGTKDLSNATGIPEIFLSKADAIDDLGCNMANIYYHLIYEMERNFMAIDVQLSKIDGSCNCSRARHYLKSIFERLCKYPFLLKEYERYIEESLQEKESLALVIKKYILIVNRIELMKRFKEMDIAVLNSTIKNWTLSEDLSSFGDPILTLKILLCENRLDTRGPSQPLKPCILSLLHSNLFIFDYANEPNTINLLHETAIEKIDNIRGTIVDNSLVNEILNCDERTSQKGQPWNLQITYFHKEKKRKIAVVVIASDAVSHQYLHSTLNQLIKPNEGNKNLEEMQGTLKHKEEANTKYLTYNRKSYTEGTLNSAQKDSVDRRSHNHKQEIFNRYSCFPDNSTSIVNENSSLPINKITHDFILNYILNRSVFNVKKSSTSQLILELGHVVLHEPICFWPKEYCLDKFNEMILERNATCPNTENFKKIEILRVNYPFLDNRVDFIIDGKIERRLSIQNTHYSPIRLGSKNGSKDDASIFSQSKSSNDPKKDGQNQQLRENRRRRQGRQKSAIDTEEVLKSMAKFHKENQLFDDSDLLNIIEFYCSTPVKNKVNCLNLKSLQNLDGEMDRNREVEKMLPSNLYRSGSQRNPLNQQRSSQLLT